MKLIAITPQQEAQLVKIISLVGASAAETDKAAAADLLATISAPSFVPSGVIGLEGGFVIGATTNFPMVLFIADHDGSDDADAISISAWGNSAACSPLHQLVDDQVCASILTDITASLVVADARGECPQHGMQ